MKERVKGREVKENLSINPLQEGTWNGIRTERRRVFKEERTISLRLSSEIKRQLISSLNERVYKRDVLDN